MRRKLVNHNTLHFRSFLAKSMTLFCAKVQKPYFCPFCPKFREREFSQIWDLKLIHGVKIIKCFLCNGKSTIKKIMNQFSAKVQKSYFYNFLGPFSSFFGKWEFSRKIGLCHFWANFEKTVLCRQVRKYRQGSIHMTLPASGRGSN